MRRVPETVPPSCPVDPTPPGPTSRRSSREDLLDALMWGQAASDPPGMREGPFRAPSSPPETPEPTKKLKRPRRIILLVKAGQAVDDFISQLEPYLEKGDICGARRRRIHRA
jgi:hypothetical protein